MEKWSFVGDVLCQQHTTLWLPELYALGLPPYVGCAGSSVEEGLTTVGALLPSAWLAARPCLVWRLPVAGECGHVLTQLAVVPWGY